MRRRESTRLKHESTNGEAKTDGAEASVGGQVNLIGRSRSQRNG